MIIPVEDILAAFEPMCRRGVERFTAQLSFADGAVLTFTSGGQFSAANQGGQGRTAVLAEKNEWKGAMHLVRHHPECSFTFSAVSTLSIRELEALCIRFMDSMVPAITSLNDEYRFLFIMTDKQLRDAVIRGGYEKEIVISGRARDCLWHAGHGKSAKETAKILSISPNTVENHLKNIREKFDKKPCSVIFIECLHRGIFGGVGLRAKNPENIQGFEKLPY